PDLVDAPPGVPGPRAGRAVRRRAAPPVRAPWAERGPDAGVRGGTARTVRARGVRPACRVADLDVRAQAAERRVPLRRRPARCAGRELAGADRDHARRPAAVAARRRSGVLRGAPPGTPPGRRDPRAPLTGVRGS